MQTMPKSFKPMEVMLHWCKTTNIKEQQCTLVMEKLLIAQPILVSTNIKWSLLRNKIPDLLFTHSVDQWDLKVVNNRHSSKNHHKMEISNVQLKMEVLLNSRGLKTWMFQILEELEQPRVLMVSKVWNLQLPICRTLKSTCNLIRSLQLEILL